MKRFWILIFALAMGFGNARAQTNLAILHSFKNSITDGSLPEGQPVLIGSSLYGMSYNGGSSSNGSVFQVSTNGSGFNLLYSFSGSTNGIDPCGSLVFDGSLFYGMTYNGGTNNGGVLFQMNTDGSSYTVLHTFRGGQTDGRFPNGSPTISGSAIYGMTGNGGTNDAGVVFGMNAGSTNITVIHSFAGGISDGDFPNEGVVLGGSTLYGTTFYGGTNDAGVAFAVDANGNNFKILHHFMGGTGDGAGPVGPLTLSGSAVYGVSVFGGTNDSGVLFKVNTNGTSYTVLHHFSGGTNDGAYPQYGGLVVTNALIYGATAYGGATNRGVVFQTSTSGTGFTVLHSFLGGTNDGANPFYSPILSGSTLCGIADGGGTNNLGVVYALTGDVSSSNPAPWEVCATVPGTTPSGVVITNVVAGQTYRIRASGSITFDFDGCYSDPDGNMVAGLCLPFTAGPNCICPGLKGVSLVGKINGGACIQLGRSSYFVASESGPLTLYYNDDITQFGDNNGTWSACITPVDCSSNSTPILTQVSAVQIVSNSIVITVPTVICQTYQLQYSDAMVTTTSWIDVDSPQAGAGGSIQFIEPLSGCTTSLCVSAPTGLVSWWPGDGNGLDIVSGNNGILSNGATFADGQDCQAFSFTNQAVVVVGNPSNLQVQTFTIEAWIKRSSSSFISNDSCSNGFIFGYGHLGYGLLLGSGVSGNNRLYLTQTDFNNDTAGPTITDTNWHHVAVTKTNTTVVFYIDGVGYANPPCSEFPCFRPFTFTTPAAIGARGDTLQCSFNGEIDEVSVYNRVLTSKEILDIYNAGAAGKCKSPLLQRFYRVLEYP